MLPTVISVSVYIPLHNTPIPSPLLSLFCCYFCCGPSRTHFYPLLLILLTWIWATCFLHSAGLRAFVRLYNDASPILYFPFPPCFVSRHENKICDMCAPMCCRSSLTAHTDPSHRSLARAPMGAGSEKRALWQNLRGHRGARAPAFLVLKLPRFVFFRLKFCCAYFLSAEKWY